MEPGEGVTVNEMTDYYAKSIKKKRSYIKDDWCIRAIQNSDYCEGQEDGRIRYWKFIPEISCL